MKIVHVIVGLNVGGAELTLKRLICSHRHNVFFQHEVVSLTEMGQVGRQLDDMGIVVKTLGMSSVWQAPFVLLKMIRLLRKAQPDIVQTWMYHADLMGGVAARIIGVRNIIWGIRSTDIGKSGNRTTLVIRRLCALLSGFVPRRIVCAADVSRRVHEDIGYSSKKMVVIPNGFELDRFIPSKERSIALRIELGVQSNEIVIGSIGRYHPVKDHFTFIGVAGSLAIRYPHVRFMLIGRGLHSENLELVKMVESTGKPDRFFLMGERFDVPEYLNIMDIYCLHSQSEGFPNVLGEAMAMGLPCVTTDVGDAAFLLDDDSSVVPSEDVQALEKVLEKFINISLERRMEIGRRNRDRVCTNFSMMIASKRYEKLYKGLCFHT